MIELSEIYAQLRIEPEDADAPLLRRYAGAAVRAIENRTNRRLYPAGPLPADAPVNALLLDDDLALAILLLVGHWDGNRSDTATTDLRSIPMGVRALIDPYRWFFE